MTPPLLLPPSISNFSCSPALWDWGDGESTNCAICRNLIMEPCIECQSGQSHADGGQCTVSWGQCSHGFHTHCIKKWLSARSVCPLDNVEWVYKKKGD